MVNVACLRVISLLSVFSLHIYLPILRRAKARRFAF